MEQKRPTNDQNTTITSILGLLYHYNRSLFFIPTITTIYLYSSDSRDKTKKR